MKYPIPLFLTLLFVMLSHSPGAAFPVPQTPAAAEDTSFSHDTREELVAQLIDEIRKPNVDFCNIVLPITKEMLDRGQFSGPVQATHDDAVFRCAVSEQRWKDANQAVGVIRESSEWSYGLFDIQVALLAKENETAIQRVRNAVRLKDSNIISISNQDFWSYFRQFKDGNRVDLANEMVSILSESPIFPELNQILRSNLASLILDEQAKAGRFKNVGSLVGQMYMYHNFVDKLADRKFSAIWPELEKAAGDNVSRILERNESHWRDKYGQNPDDRDAFQSLAHALHFSGKFEEAVKLTSTIDRQKESFMALSEDDAWALNIESYALDSLGRHDEAEKTFDAIVALPHVAGKNDWLVNFAINRASRLVQMGHWQKGLEAARYADTIPGSPYAKMLILKAKLCALKNLGKTQLAYEISEEIFKLRKDSYDIAAESFLCLNDTDKAAQIAIEGMQNADQKSNIVTKLQRPEFELFYTVGLLPTMHQKLRTHPEVKEIFDALARDIPIRFIPEAGSKRVKFENRD